LTSKLTDLDTNAGGFGGDKDFSDEESEKSPFACEEGC